MTLLLMELLNASGVGVILSVWLWMWCHNGAYSWRDYGVMLLMLGSIILRYRLGAPPESHFYDIFLVNLIFMFVTAAVWAKPSPIVLQQHKNDCWICGAVDEITKALGSKVGRHG